MKSVEQQALEFIRKVADSIFDSPFEVRREAQEILSNICDHANVLPDRYCQVCGWHNVPTKRDSYECDHKNTHLQSGVCLNRGKETK